MQNSNFIPYDAIQYSDEKSLTESHDFHDFMDRRRSLRDFSDRPVAKTIIENIIKTASSAPSGAHKQPWTFCAVSNLEVKKQIRAAAEKEEYENYHGRMSAEWLEDLAIFETDWKKEFLETAPWLIIVFKKVFDDIEGEKHKNYYVNESVGLATGFLLAAIHKAGLVSLTHTPSPMRFLQKILKRPDNERPFLLIPVAYPPKVSTVPDLKRKDLNEVCVFFE